MSQPLPTEPPKGDAREWTSPEQKSFLQLRIPAFQTVRGTRAAKGWLAIQLRDYFDKFPVKAVTPEDQYKHGSGWTIAKKHELEAKVSLQCCDDDDDDLPVCLESPNVV